MTFLQASLLVAEKEFRHYRHDALTFALTVIAPLAQMLLFGYALDPRVQNLPLAVQNLDEERYSRALLSSLESTQVFRVTSEAKSEQELQNLLRRGAARAAIQIPRGYSSDIFYGRPSNVRLWVDGSDAVVASQAVQTAQAVGLKQAIGTQTRVSVSSPDPLHTQVLFNPEKRPANFFVPGIVAILTQTTTLLLVSLSFVKERERGTLDQLRLTTIGPGALIAGKLAASALTGIVTGLLLSVLMSSVFQVPISGSIWLLATSLLLFQCSALGLGLIITAQARNQAQALQLTFLIGIPNILLSGFVYPRETMPLPILWFSNTLPTTYAVQIIRGIVLRGAGVVDLAPALMASAVLGIVYISVGAILLRRALR